MTIFYFSSTGNCLYVAKKIGGELVSIPSAMRKGSCVCEDDAIGLVFPVFGLSVPPYILDFLKMAEFKTPYLFAVLTYGTWDAASVLQLQKAGAESGKEFSYINGLLMQENYLMGFAMENQKKPADQDEKLEAIVNDIKERKTFIKHNSALERFLTWTHQKDYHYSRGIGITDKVRVEANCSGCGTCAKLCPLGNIKIEDGKPVFGTDCLSCLACIQNCPTNALHLSNEKSAVRYRNPEITLQELITANE